MSGGASYDVVVVGAGPAGASAAYSLGEAGLCVLVLEKAALPRYKPCGGGVPKAAFAWFPFDFSPVIEREIRRVRFRYSDGREAAREVAMELPGKPVAMVMRDRFDLHILEQARADVRDGCEVVTVLQDATGVDLVTQRGEGFRGRYVIAADGANSRIARDVGLRRQRFLGASIEVEIPADADLLNSYSDTALFLLGSPSYGYQWVFPKAEHLSVGIGTFASSGSAIREALHREMATLGIDVDRGSKHGHPLPVYLGHEPLHCGRVLLAGDAGALVDPLLGEGIRHALNSGRLAAEAVIRGDPAGYTDRVHREIGDDLLWGIRWARLFYNAPRLSFELGVRNPLFINEFLRLFGGQSTYRRMALCAAPFLLRGIGRRLPLA